MTKKFLLLRHIEENKEGYMRDFQDIFPELKQKDIANLLQELKKKKKDCVYW